MTIQEIQTEIIEEFEFFENWNERYEYIVELGETLPSFDEKYRVSENMIGGCQSQAWLHAELKNGNVLFFADGDSILAKGIISLLLRVYSDQPAAAILEDDASFLDKIGLKEHLSPTRANGLIAMVKRIKFYALVLR